MSYIGGANETCTTPPEFTGPNDGDVSISPSYGQLISIDWSKSSFGLESTVGYPLRRDNFTTSLWTLGIFETGFYSSGAVIRYKEESSFSFGYYTHFGVVQVAGPDSPPNDFSLGYIPTSAAIWIQIGGPVEETRAVDIDSSAHGQLESALYQGRTQGLDRAFMLYDEAKQEYVEGHYTQSMAYAEEAIDAVRNSSKPSSLTVPMLLVGVATVIPITVSAYKMSKKGKRRESHED